MNYENEELLLSIFLLPFFFNQLFQIWHRYSSGESKVIFTTLRETYRFHWVEEENGSEKKEKGEENQCCLCFSPSILFFAVLPFSILSTEILYQPTVLSPY